MDLIGTANRRRTQKGVCLIELPVVLWLMFIVIILPLLGLATITLKSALMNAAVQDGVFMASKAKTFLTGTPDKPAAVTLADNTIKQSAGKFTGLTIDSINTNIVITSVTSGSITRSSTKLAVPADTSKNIYQIETVVKGKINPLFQLNPAVVGNIPGLSTPMLVSFAAREMAENPQGLDK